MPRTARVVIPGYPHHVTQRGSRRQRTFFRDEDYCKYLELLASYRRRFGVEIWAYCLMPNHVHHVAVPGQRESLAKLLQLTHQRYSRYVNARENWEGHLWQSRFHSFVMDEAHLLAAVRYVELNPVRAGLCRLPEDWPWSSVHSHLHARADPAVDREPMCGRIRDWSTYLSEGVGGPTEGDLRTLTSSGRPGGDDAFISMLEDLTGKRLRQLKPGPKPGD